MGPVVRHGVGHVRVVAQLGHRLPHGLAVLDRELLRAARERALRIGARGLLGRWDSVLARRSARYFTITSPARSSAARGGGGGLGAEEGQSGC